MFSLVAEISTHKFTTSLNYYLWRKKMKPINLYFANNFKKIYLDSNLELPFYQKPAIFGINFIKGKHGWKAPVVRRHIKPVLYFCKTTNNYSSNIELQWNMLMWIEEQCSTLRNITKLITLLDRPERGYITKLPGEFLRTLIYNNEAISCVSSPSRWQWSTIGDFQIHWQKVINLVSFGICTNVPAGKTN